MHLHKWCGNLPEITSNLQEYAFLESDETKALGIIWNPKLDFLFRIEQQRPTSFTKRMLLSTIARIFDPLGLLGPIITWAKIFMQRLWLLELGWNDELPFKEEKEWCRFIDSLEAVNNMAIDRCIVIHRAESIELHAFSDASEKAYGSSIYLMSISALGEVKVCLVTSKSRVSPLKQISISRIELCGAVLVAKLMKKDDKGVLRVGGRLEKASIPYNQKHPAVLAKNSKLSKIYFITLYKKLFHVGPQGLLNAVRLRFWASGGRNIVKKTVHTCVVCFKCKAIPSSQIMGNLPYERVNMAHPFSVTDLDLGGPYFVAYKNQRKDILNKIYVCVCICLVTRAIHLEILSDLTSDAIIATLKRFMSRRGKCSKIFTDNATNFVGANSQLKVFYKTLNFPDQNLAAYFAEEGIEWNFIPPSAPHMGGLWEAGIKSVKYHLKRALGRSRLTYEEFETVIIQVERILNSRPLTPIYNDFDNFEIKPLAENNKGNSGSLEKWSTNYLNTLQQRGKWMIEKDNVMCGTMVIVKEDFTLVCSWLLERVVEVYHGSDGKMRTGNYLNKKECQPIVIRTYTRGHPQCQSDRSIDRHSKWCSRYGDELDLLSQRTNGVGTRQGVQCADLLRSSEMIGGVKEAPRGFKELARKLTRIFFNLQDQFFSLSSSKTRDKGCGGSRTQGSKERNCDNLLKTE
ncbi:integrase catalytic domain-containing protein [Trichonephila clavipes]|uniref:Integrase catalytic domain-containing protein n=1 Tax=Trichonephila clavipes TaxID=2585209 RepID=A0A8X7BIJ7_TRICX|nr:integrase catalytic domain-containing protein [Trichonephila clavipes]